MAAKAPAVRGQRRRITAGNRHCTPAQCSMAVTAGIAGLSSRPKACSRAGDTRSGWRSRAAAIHSLPSGRSARTGRRIPAGTSMPANQCVARAPVSPRGGRSRCSAVATARRGRAVRRRRRRRPRRRFSCPSCIRTQPWSRRCRSVKAGSALLPDRLPDHAARPDRIATVRCGQGHQGRCAVRHSYRGGAGFAGGGLSSLAAAAG